jgi:hypothetical protein
MRPTRSRYDRRAPRIRLAARALELIEPGGFLHTASVALRSTRSDRDELTVSDPKVDFRVGEPLPRRVVLVDKRDNQPIVL